MSKKKAVEKEDGRGEGKNSGEKCRNKKTYVFNLSTVSGQKYVVQYYFTENYGE